MAPKAASAWRATFDERIVEPIKRELAALRAERDGLLVRARVAERERDQARAKVTRLEVENAALKAAVEEARRAAKRQAAPFARRKRKENPKRPGRAAGHAPAHRPAPAPPQIHRHIDVPLSACPRCGHDVEGVVALTPQYVTELAAPPEARLVTTRYQQYSGYCRCCRRRVQSRHPDQTSAARGAAGIQFGPRLLAVALDLHHRIGVTYRKVSGIFALIFGLHVAAATWARAGRRVGKKLEPTYLSLVAAARGADVNNVDETGWYITEAGAKKPWLHVFSAPTEKITLFAIRLSRGRDVALEILGDDYAGVIGVDGWAAYTKLPCRKGQCAGHLLRRSAELREVQKQGSARFPITVQQLLLDLLAIKAIIDDLDEADQESVREQLRAQIRALLMGRIAEPANLRFAQHLRRHEDELLTCLEIPALAATNNEAEREIRPAVVMRKISAGNRTLAGAHDHEIIASVSRTAERHDLRLPDLLPGLLRSTDALILPVLADRPMPPPVAPLPAWKEMTSHAHPDRLRRGSGRPHPEHRAHPRPPPA